MNKTLLLIALTALVGCTNTTPTESELSQHYKDEIHFIYDENNHDINKVLATIAHLPHRTQGLLIEELYSDADTEEEQLQLIKTRVRLNY